MTLSSFTFQVSTHLHFQSQHGTAGWLVSVELTAHPTSWLSLAAGDLLRAEQKREGSEYGAMIKQYITEGKIVPMEVTIKLLENAMRAAMEEDKANSRFLIDGFPRQMDQAIKFDASVSTASSLGPGRRAR